MAGDRFHFDLVDADCDDRFRVAAADCARDVDMRDVVVLSLGVLRVDRMTVDVQLQRLRISWNAPTATVSQTQQGRAQDFSLATRPKAHNGVGFLGRGQQPSSHQLGGLRSSVPQQGSGRGARPKADSGVGAFVNGAATPSQPARGPLGSAVSSPSGVRDRAPTAQRFFTIFSTQDGLS